MHVETIVGIELLRAAQGIDFRCRDLEMDAGCLGQGTAAAYSLIREHVAFVDEDVVILFW